MFINFLIIISNDVDNANALGVCFLLLRLCLRYSMNNIFFQQTTAENSLILNLIQTNDFIVVDVKVWKLGNITLVC